MLRYDLLFTWSDWQPLEFCWLGAAIPAKPGLYRLRRCGQSQLDYIGQTGDGKMTLSKRLGMLRGGYAADMPYRDPHTAAPALWALRHSLACHFEVSVVPIEGSTPWRKGLESLAISLYRQQERQSPTVNFGRIVSGYSMSSANNSKLVLQGKRFRGGLTTQVGPNHLPSLAPVDHLTEDPQAHHWCGHQWSAWQPLASTIQQLSKGQSGLYRLRSSGSATLLYIGQGNLKDRLNAHQKKALQPYDAQSEVFATAPALQCSWVHNANWQPHQRLELENDLIASHLLMTETIPPAQFLGL